MSGVYAAGESRHDQATLPVTVCRPPAASADGFRPLVKDAAPSRTNDP
jgi:hypothetical protein